MRKHFIRTLMPEFRKRFGEKFKIYIGSKIEVIQKSGKHVDSAVWAKTPLGRHLLLFIKSLGLILTSLIKKFKFQKSGGLQIFCFKESWVDLCSKSTDRLGRVTA